MVGALVIGIVVYLVGLGATTLVAVIFFEYAPNIVVVPLEYLIPFFFAVAAYRKAAQPTPAELELRKLQARRTCPACGYDLRATPDRCPECGTAAAPR